MSVDGFLGLPINIMSYGVLLHLLCRITGYLPGTLTGFLEDLHLYENHLDQIKEQLSRQPFDLPQLRISDRIGLDFPLDEVEPEDIWLEGYECHPAIKAPMAA